jgi:hypothetical protein
MRRSQCKLPATAKGDFLVRAYMYLEGELTMESLADLEHDLADPKNADAFVTLCLNRAQLTEALTRRPQTDHV